VWSIVGCSKLQEEVGEECYVYWLGTLPARYWLGRRCAFWRTYEECRHAKLDEVAALVAGGCYVTCHVTCYLLGTLLAGRRFPFWRTYEECRHAKLDEVAALFAGGLQDVTYCVM
jgi:hypothetical protein